MTAPTTTRPTHGPAFVDALATLLCGTVTHDQGPVIVTPHGILRCSCNGAVYLNARQQVGTFSDGPEVIAARVRAVREVAA